MGTKNTHLTELSEFSTGKIAAMKNAVVQMRQQHPTWPANKVMKEIGKKFNLKFVDGTSKKYSKSNTKK